MINDGSTDDSGKICRHYADIDKRVRYYEQENRGISAARNAGIGHATGKYYSFIDADDFVSDRYIEILYHSLIEHDADISIGSYSMVAADQLPDFSSDGSDICITGREAILQLFEDDHLKFVYAWGRLYKSELFDQIRYPEGRAWEDFDVSYKMFDLAKTVVLNSSRLYCYYQAQDGISRGGFRKERLEILISYKNRVLYFQEKGDQQLYTLAEREYFNKLVKAVILVKEYLAGRDRQETVRYFRNEIKKEFRTVIRINLSDNCIGIWQKAMKIVKEIWGRFELPWFEIIFRDGCPFF